MAKFICVMSGKGGVGKTTTATNLGLAIQKIGEDVIVLDGNLSSPNLSLHLGNTYFPVTIHDVMQNIHHISKAIYNHHTNLKIIPAELGIDAMKLVDFNKLEKNLQDLHLMTKYLIIDGSPGLGRESTQLINISDEILVVTNQDTPSLVDAKRLINMVKRQGKTITGVIITKYKKRKYRLSKDEISEFLEVPILATIKEDKRFEKTINKKTPYIHLYPKAKASQGYYKIAEAITGRTHY
ncbi:P-loop NTPase [Candidatus Woesearchaeota archaeon]|nr:P-loop NTPase [Candidatus Woesearchaeota archaeon]MCF8012957.1 P-loop NTPase [Candidatus Woesearchaeota archaeon]